MVNRVALFGIGILAVSGRSVPSQASPQLSGAVFLFLNTEIYGCKNMRSVIFFKIMERGGRQMKQDGP